jgi:hypothetical protein
MLGSKPGPELVRLVVPYKPNKKYQIGGTFTVNVKAGDAINCGLALNGSLVPGSESTFVSPRDDANCELGFLTPVICAPVLYRHPCAPPVLDSRPTQFSKWMSKWFDLPNMLGLYIWAFLPPPYPEQYFQLTIAIGEHYIANKYSHPACITSKLWITLI